MKFKVSSKYPKNFTNPTVSKKDRKKNYQNHSSYLWDHNHAEAVINQTYVKRNTCAMTGLLFNEVCNTYLDKVCKLYEFRTFSLLESLCFGQEVSHSAISKKIIKTRKSFC